MRTPTIPKLKKSINRFKSSNESAFLPFQSPVTASFAPYFGEDYKRYLFSSVHESFLFAYFSIVNKIQDVIEANNLADSFEYINAEPIKPA